MIIDRKFFDECFCPCPGIGRVCLRGDNALPETIINLAQTLDGSDYSPSCFAVDISDNAAKLVYMGEHEFFDLEIVCDNIAELKAHYTANAEEHDKREACL